MQKIDRNEHKPLTQKHIDEVLKYCNDIVKLVWKQEYARTQRMFPNLKWTEGLFDRYIDGLAEQYAVKGYQPVNADVWLTMSEQQKEEWRKNPPMVKNIKNPSQVAKQEKILKEKAPKISEIVR